MSCPAHARRRFASGAADGNSPVNSSDRTSGPWPVTSPASSRATATFIKLNTNENPYPPSPRVFEAIRGRLTGDRLRKYPDPMGTHFRHVAGRVLGVDPDSILIGNGSDDILTILTRAFVPEGGLIVVADAELLALPHAGRDSGRPIPVGALHAPIGGLPTPGRCAART